MKRGLVLALAVATTATMAHTADTRTAIRTFPLGTAESLGRAMFRQDAAAWVASDALQPLVADPQTAQLRGWFVEDTPTGQRVRFLRDDGHGLEVAYDVDVTPDRQTKVSQPKDRTLTAEEQARYAAWVTAVSSLRDQPVCTRNFNHIVLNDPEGDGWLVWLMVPLPEMGAIPVGGHIRFTISADGHTILRRDALSMSCLVLPKPAPPPGGQPLMAFFTHLTSPVPLETHVFLQLQSGQALAIGAGGHVWTIIDGHVTDQGPMKPPAPELSR